MMTVTAIIAGLLPILWGGGAGASVMKRIAAPMVGGMLSSTILTLLVIPTIYSLWRQREIVTEDEPREMGRPVPIPPAGVRVGVGVYTLNRRNL
jgi:Cu(I)/Ag(I) efflux system membrane protein CusA/SilA